MNFKEMYTSHRAVACQKDLAKFVLDEMAGWDNPAAHQMIIDHMKHFHEEYGLSADLALVSAYSLCVIASTDQGEKCLPVTTASQETNLAETSTSEKPATNSALSRVARSLGGYFEPTISRLSKLSASWSSRFGRWVSRGARWKKPSGSWRVANGRALVRKS